MAKKGAGFEFAKECFAGYGVDVDDAVRAALAIPVSVHCWQGDDVTGFEKASGGADGGIAVTVPAEVTHGARIDVALHRLQIADDLQRTDLGRA